jgi:methylaspartate ammonia-lyase
MDSKNQQIDILTQITQHLRKLGSPVKIVADEWCNNYNDIVDFADAACCHMIQIKSPDLGSLHNAVEAVLYCKNNEIEPYLGGSCNETDISVRASIHAALAAQAQRILARPGLGFDVGFTITRNEMTRAIQIIKMRRG